jgi:NADP-reducing hydrogenase subunit HndB
MSKLCIADLQKIKGKNRSEYDLKNGAYKAKVVVHMGTCGVASGALNILSVLKDEISLAKREDIIVIPSGCAGFCAHEPMVTIETVDHPPVKYVDLNEEKIRELFRGHIMEGKPIGKYALVSGSEATY